VHLKPYDIFKRMNQYVVSLHNESMKSEKYMTFCSIQRNIR